MFELDSRDIDCITHLVGRLRTRLVAAEPQPYEEISKLQSAANYLGTIRAYNQHYSCIIAVAAAEMQICATLPATKSHRYISERGAQGSSAWKYRITMEQDSPRGASKKTNLWRPLRLYEASVLLEHAASPMIEVQ
jgi:hypothetical protein